jgi:hypothetical protein
MSVVVVNYDGIKFEIDRAQDIDLNTITDLDEQKTLSEIIKEISLNPTNNKKFLVKIDKSSGNCSTGFSIGSNCFTIDDGFTYDIGKTGLSIVNEAFLDIGSSSSSSSSLAPVSSSSSLAPVPNVLTEFYSKLIEMGIGESKASDLFTKYNEKINEKNIPEIFDEIFKNDINTDTQPIAPSPIENGHGPNGLRQVSGTDCFISSVIHLMKDIESYDPNTHLGLTEDCLKNSNSNSEANQKKIDNSKLINAYTYKMYNYIGGAIDDKEYLTKTTDTYSGIYTELRALFELNPGVGEPIQCLTKYIEIANCPNEIIQMVDLLNEDTENQNTNEIQKEADIDGDGNLTETNIGDYTADYLILNRTVLVDTTDRDAWTDIIFPTELGEYTLVGKILHPLGHYVYVSYIDPENPILYNDGDVSEFKVRDNVYDEKTNKLVFPEIEGEWTEENYLKKSQEYQEQKMKILKDNSLMEPTYTESLFLRQNRLVTSCLYKKNKSIASSLVGSGDSSLVGSGDSLSVGSGDSLSVGSGDTSGSDDTSGSGYPSSVVSSDAETPTVFGFAKGGSRKKSKRRKNKKTKRNYFIYN